MIKGISFPLSPQSLHDTEAGIGAIRQTSGFSAISNPYVLHAIFNNALFPFIRTCSLFFLFNVFKNCLICFIVSINRITGLFETLYCFLCEKDGKIVYFVGDINPGLGKSQVKSR